MHIVGFPAASTFSTGFSRDSQVQPTITEGPVTAVRSTGSAMPVFQTQASASPGNSVGPVLTDSGDAVGVLVANAVNSDGTAAAYAQAVDAFYAEHYKEACHCSRRSRPSIWRTRSR